MPRWQDPVVSGRIENVFSSNTRYLQNGSACSRADITFWKNTFPQSFPREASALTSSEGSVLTLRESASGGQASDGARGQACALPAAAGHRGARTRALSSPSPGLPLSGRCMSVPFRPRIAPVRSWAGRGSPAPLEESAARPCGSGVALPLPRGAREGGREEGRRVRRSPTLCPGACLVSRSRRSTSRS